jgi:hypothetical protein
VRRVWGSLLVGCLLAVAGVVAAAPASACSCVGGTTQQYFDGADAVFTGTLVPREVTHPGAPISSSGDPALHVFTVDAVFKGNVHERQGVVSADAGASCGLELSGPGPFVVFAFHSDDVAADQFTADLCGGTARADAGLEAELAALAALHGSPPSSADPLPGAAGAPAPQRTASSVPVAALAGTAAIVLLVTGLLLRRRAVRSGR